MRPSARIGDAENSPLRRFCQRALPLTASSTLAVPASPIRNSFSPSSNCDDREPVPWEDFQAICVLVTSPVPSGRTARNFMPPAAVLM